MTGWCSICHNPIYDTRASEFEPELGYNDRAMPAFTGRLVYFCVPHASITQYSPQYYYEHAATHTNDLLRLRYKWDNIVRLAWQDAVDRCVKLRGEVDHVWAQVFRAQDQDGRVCLMNRKTFWRAFPTVLRNENRDTVDTINAKGLAAHWPAVKVFDDGFIRFIAPGFEAFETFIPDGCIAVFGPTQVQPELYQFTIQGTISASTSTTIPS